MAFPKSNGNGGNQPGQGGKAMNDPLKVGEPALSEYGHEGLRGAISRSAKANPIDGGRGGGISGSIISRLRKGQSTP